MNLKIPNSNYLQKKGMRTISWLKLLHQRKTSEVLTLREQNQKLLDERAMVLKNLANEKEKDEELRRYKGFCDDYKKQVRLVVYVVVLMM